jgi:MSHA type pilus biogenesis protein MshL
MWGNVQFWRLGWSLVLLTGCQNLRPLYHDDQLKKTKDDFRRGLGPNRSRRAFVPQEPARPIAKPVDPRSAWPAVFHKKVSLSLTGQIPLREAFLELARQAHISIVCDDFPSSTNVYYQGEGQCLGDVIENLCGAGALRYRFQNNALHIQQDTAHMRVHNVQFLLGSRKTSTQTTIKTDVFNEGLNKESKIYADNGATITVNSDASVDFWGELEQNLAMVLSAKGPTKRSPAPYSLNRYAGLLTIWGTERQHQNVARYLSQLKQAVTAQILIEAKIIEIDLKDEYKGGVNWAAFINKFNPAVGAAGSVLREVASKRPSMDMGSRDGQYTFNLNSNHLSALVDYAELFGTVRTLANPRQTVINNQSAVLKVAHNEVFFSLEIKDDSDPLIVRQRAQSRIQTVPIGLILFVHPVLNSQTGEIIVSLHPTISRVIGTKQDPATALYARNGGEQVPSEVPIVQVREMDSVVVAREGQVIVMGGLMEERAENQSVGVPILGDIPGIGQLFSSKKIKRRVTELIILLSLKRVHGNSSFGPADQTLYQDFTSDPRPLDGFNPG